MVFVTFLEEAEFLVGGGEGSLEVGFVAAEAVEGVGFVVVNEEGLREVVGAGEGRFIWMTLFLQLVEEAGFGEAEAAETPVEEGNLFHEDLFES